MMKPSAKKIKKHLKEDVKEAKKGIKKDYSLMKKMGSRGK